MNNRDHRIFGGLTHDEQYVRMVRKNLSRFKPQLDLKKINLRKCFNCGNLINTASEDGPNLRCPICSVILNIPWLTPLD